MSFALILAFFLVYSVGLITGPLVLFVLLRLVLKVMKRRIPR